MRSFLLAGAAVMVPAGFAMAAIPSPTMLLAVDTNALIMGGQTGAVRQVGSQNCQPVGQSTSIMSMVCVRTLSSGGHPAGSPYTSQEYAYSYSYRIIPDQADLNAAVAAAAANQTYYSDKLAQYLGVEMLSSPVTMPNGSQIRQNSWIANWTMLIGPGTNGDAAGLELDLNNDQQDGGNMGADFGLWLTGGGQFPNKDAVYVTGANANSAYQWHNGLHCASEVEDACVQIDSISATKPMYVGVRLCGTFSGYGMDMTGASFAGGLFNLPAAAKQLILDGQAGGGHYWGYPTTGDERYTTAGQTFDFLDTGGLEISNISNNQSGLTFGPGMPAGVVSLVGANLPGTYTNYLLWLGINGANKLLVDNNGGLTAATYTAAPTGYYDTIGAKNASGSNGVVNFGTPARPANLSLAQLPPCSAAILGTEAYVTDGRKSGEVAGSGSGVLGYCSYASKGGSLGWMLLNTATVVEN